MSYTCLLHSSWSEGWRWLSHISPAQHTACSPPQSQAPPSGPERKFEQTADIEKSYQTELFLRFITLPGLACCLILQAVVADVAGPWGQGGARGGDHGGQG